MPTLRFILGCKISPIWLTFRPKPELFETCHLRIPTFIWTFTRKLLEFHEISFPARRRMGLPISLEPFCAPQWWWFLLGTKSARIQELLVALAGHVWNCENPSWVGNSIFGRSSCDFERPSILSIHPVRPDLCLIRPQLCISTVRQF